MVKRGYVEARDRDNQRAIEAAANAFFSDALVTP